MRTVNFDLGGYNKYRKLNLGRIKYLDTTHKNVLYVEQGPGRADVLAPYYISFRIDLGAEYTVDELSFDRYYTFNESFTAPFHITVTLLHSDSSVAEGIFSLSENSNSSNNSQWITETPSFDPVSNVRYIDFYLNLEWQGYAPTEPEVGTYPLENLAAVYLDNIQISDQGLSGYPAPNHTGRAACPSHHGSAGQPLSNYPISLRTGEKYEEVTDLSIYSSAGVLSFTRSYNQNKRLDEKYSFMGLGWQHNHNINLSENTLVTPHIIVVRFTNGSETFFTEQTTNYYEADAGSVSTIIKDAETGEFTLITSDKSTYFFDNNGKLISHVWPNNETWEYTYSGDLLIEVSDDYGRSLQFSYIDNPGQYDDGQLWRVGDHTADDLDTSTPVGRYIEFGYILEKTDGATVSTPRALLSSVQDVRGNVWTYDYYGQHLGETDGDQLNFLTQVGSPSVDTTGDGVADGAILLKKLTYSLSSGTITQITQELGIQDADPALLEIDFAFQPSNENITTETIAGKVKTHRFVQDMYAGMEDPAGNVTQESVDNNFRPTLQQDANGNTIVLTWSNDGKFLTHVSDQLNHETQFVYNISGDSADTLSYSVDAEGNITQYTYEDSSNPQLPTRIKVVDINSTALNWQEFTYDSFGRTLTETILDPNNGTTVLQLTTRIFGSSGNSAGLLESETIEDPFDTANNIVTTHTYDSFGRVIKTQRSSLLGTCQFSYTVYDEAGNVIATVCGHQGTTPPTNISEAIAMFDANDEVKKDNKVTLNEYDSLGRRIKTTLYAGSDFAQTTLTVYDALNRVIRTISNYVADVGLTNPYTTSATAFDHGSDNTANLVTDTAYNALGKVKSQQDITGNVTLFGYDDAGRLVKTIQNASVPDYNNDYIGISPDPSLEEYTEETTVDVDIVTHQSYDAAGNVVKTVDALGTVNYTMYDEMNRPVKTIRAAKDEATLELNPGDMGYDETNDPRSDAYEISDNPDHDLIDVTEYDKMGRVTRTRHLLEHRSFAQWETQLFGFDSLGRQVRTIRNASQPDYDLTADPSLAAYPINPDPDKDIVTQTVYEASGRVRYTEDMLGNKTWIAYDGLGRQIKTIVNAVGSEIDDGYYDPRSDSYIVSSDADKDLIASTVYDSDGRVQSTVDVLGRVNRNVYDASGRLVRTIGNYIEQDSTDPFEWFWSDTNHRWEYADDDDTPIAHGEDNDQNIISDTQYDAQGRVLQTLDTRQNVTHFVYDVLGRRIKTITNYVEQASPPETWIWSTINNRWEDGDDNAIDFGENNDQNRINTTLYDLAGRISHTRDVAGIETRFTYDGLGRRLSAVSNYVDGIFDPDQPDEDLISTTTYNKGGQVVATTDARGTETNFTYDSVGRRLTVTRAASTELASVDYTCYDKAGRVLRTIQNWSDGESEDSPDAKDERGNWLFVPETHGANNDLDLVTSYLLDGVGRVAQVVDANGYETLMRYDKAGQVVWQSDPTYSVTRFIYDQANRRRRVVQGYLPIPVNEKIAYYSYSSGNYEVFTMDTDGDNQTNVSDNNSGQDYDPAWSPDDSQIVFTSDRAGESPTYFFDLYLVDANGDNQQRLTDLAGYTANPAWSPDGGQIVFCFKPGDRTENIFDLYLMNVDGTHLRLLFSDESLGTSRPRWSPDGQRIVFFASDDNFATSNIYVIHIDGTQLLNLTNSSTSVNLIPSWLWNGGQFVFQSTRQGEPDIYVMNANGSQVVNLTQYGAAGDYAPDWSPDGSRIVFHSKRDTDNREIYVMDADGSNVTRLTTDTNYNQFPVWSKQTADPALWSWNESGEVWEDGDSNPIPHGENSDRNIIVDVTFDKAGRVVEQREPLGHLTTYAYDNLNRRKSLTNQLENEWSTAYIDLENGGTQVTMTYPGITDHTDYTVQRDFDRLGRLVSIVYGDAAGTPDVVMSYDAAGNRIKMSEYDEADFAHLSRETSFSYDALHRLTAAAFDTDGDTTPDETVSYAYDAGGLRTQLTLPDDLTITYHYDARGRLILMSDWDHQVSEFMYDQANRHLMTGRSNGLRSIYAYDPAGRLTQIQHIKDTSEIASATTFTGTNVLDDFDRADGSLGANWERADQFAIDTHEVVVSYSAQDLYWVRERYGADQEVFVTLSSINPSSEEIDLVLKAQGTYTFAEIEVYYNPANEIAQVWTYTLEDGWVLHGESIPVTLADGDQFGARAFRNGIVEVYKNGVLLDSRDVTSWPYYADGGYVGLFFYLAENTTFDDFGGGNILVSAPASAILDTFNRADGSIGANWSGATTGYAIDTNRLIPSDAGEAIYWNGERFGPNQEVYAKFTSIDLTGSDIGLVLKRQSTDWGDGALAIVYSTSLNRVQLLTNDPVNGWMQRGSDIAVALQDGDVLGAKAFRDGKVEIYQNGLLMAVQSVIDWPFFAEGGYIGFVTTAIDTEIDDFGGGNIAEPIPDKTLAHFAYEVDGRGNRTQVLEALAQPDTTDDTIIAYNDPQLVLAGTWSEVSGFAESSDTDAILKFMFLADHITLTLGKGPDHSIYDVYLDGEFWQSIDGYAASATQEDIQIAKNTLVHDGPHLLEIGNQNSKNGSSSGYKVRFQQATIPDKTFDLHTIEYNYDALARLKEARYNPGMRTAILDADLLRQYLYGFNRAGNRTEQSVAVNGGSQTVTNYDYNAANQLISDGTYSYEYDNNGNLKNKMLEMTTVDSYTWDRANRLLSMGGVDYQYDGEGRRVQQTVSSVVTKYLLDIQPGLAGVLSETTDSNITRNVFSPRGIHAQQDSSDNWQWIAQDGLGNVREVLDNSFSVLESRNYGPYGDTFGGTITSALGYEAPNFGFTGELVDGSGLLDLRARRYNMEVGTFASLDPFEGIRDRAMSLNGYSWVEGNTPNGIDPSGMLFWQFPSGRGKLGYTTPAEGIYDQTDYDKREKGYSGAWIGKFLEIVNGFGATHLEFTTYQPVGQKRVDALVFGPHTLDYAALNSVNPVFRANGPAYVYEIAPLLDGNGYPSNELFREWKEAGDKIGDLITSKVTNFPFSLTGILPEDHWPVPQFSFGQATAYAAGMPYDWLNADWQRSNSLFVTGLIPGQIPGFPRIGIFSPFGLSFADLRPPTVYYLYLIVDGLLVYVTENEVKKWQIDSAASLSLAELGAKVFGGMENMYKKRRGKLGLPPIADPVPRFAYSAQPDSGEWGVCANLSTGLCAAGAAGIIGTGWLLWQVLSGVNIPLSSTVPIGTDQAYSH